MKKILFICLVSFLIVIMGIQSVKKAELRGKLSQSDFTFAYRFGNNALQGENIYGSIKRDGYGCRHQLYPPPFSLIIAPFAVFPPGIAKGLWYLLDILCIAAILLTGKRIFYLKSKPAAYFFILTVIMTNRFLHNHLMHGQANLIMMAFVMLSIYYYIENRDIPAGIMLAAAICIKVVPLFLLVYFVIKKKFKLLLSCLAGIAAIFLITGLLLGIKQYPSLLGEWLSSITGSGFQEIVISKHNQALAPAISRMAGLTDAGIGYFIKTGADFKALAAKGLLYIFSIILFLGTFLPAIKKIKPDRFDYMVDFSKIMICMLLLSPISRKYFFVAMLLPHMTLVYYFLRCRDRFIGYVLLVSFVLTSLTSEVFIGASASDWCEFYSFITISALLAFAGLMYVEKKPSSI